LKKVAILDIKDLDIEPFSLDKVLSQSSIKEVSKKEIKELADELGIEYESTHISFAKKILNVYLKRL